MLSNKIRLVLLFAVYREKNERETRIEDTHVIKQNDRTCTHNFEKVNNDHDLRQQSNKITKEYTQYEH